MNSSFAQRLENRELFSFEGESCHCLVCPHHCLLRPGGSGACGVRSFDGENVYAPFGQVSALALDPIEKKPFYHVLPGTEILSLGTFGCNLHCGFCQNWEISQVGGEVSRPGRSIGSEEFVFEARRLAVPAVAATYNEPLVASEWFVEVFRRAREADILTAIVSNGCATAAAGNFLLPWVDLANIDLKSFREEGYLQLGGKLGAVLDTIREIHQRGIWLEVTTLVVPGFNDSDAELNGIAQFLVGLDPDIPWHVSAYHPAYRWIGTAPRTSVETIENAVGIGMKNGLRHVYAGNVPGNSRQTTCCPRCGARVVSRNGFSPPRNDMRRPGQCPVCDNKIAGIWA